LPTSGTLATTAQLTPLLDEDDMASNSAISAASQQSIKAYVDNSVGIWSFIVGGFTAQMNHGYVIVLSTPVTLPLASSGEVGDFVTIIIGNTNVNSTISPNPSDTITYPFPPYVCNSVYIENHQSVTFRRIAATTFTMDNYSMGVTFNVLERALFAGGYNGSTYLDSIEAVNITTRGNVIDFGDLTVARNTLGGCSSIVRAIFCGGNLLSLVMDYVTIATAGDASAFGDLIISHVRPASCSSNTRGILAGGYISSYIDSISYMTIATLGNSVDFGDLLTAKNSAAGCSSPTRGLIAGGTDGSLLNTIEYVTIATTGNASFFSTLTVARREAAGASSKTRGMFAGGYTSSFVSTIDYVTIATEAIAQYFGDLTVPRNGLGATASPTQALFAAGISGSGETTSLDYVVISTMTNAYNFGDLAASRYGIAGCSNCHGGL
jgi:hypothetical protein